MKLRGRLRLNMNRTITFVGNVYDGTSFECNVDIHDFHQNEEFVPDRYVVDGWLYVTQEAKQGDRCYLTLPKPSLQFGKQVLVNELQLMPMHVSIEDFNPQRMGGSVKQAKLENGGVVEVTPEEVLVEKLTKKKASKSHKT